MCLILLSWFLPLPQFIKKETPPTAPAELETATLTSWAGPCSPDLPHCSCPQSPLTPQKYDQWGIFSSALGPKQPQVEKALRKGLVSPGTALRKPGSGLGGERAGSPLMGAVPPHWQILSWKSQSAPIPEVNHESPDKKRRELKKFLSQWYLGFLNILIHGCLLSNLMGSLNVEMQEVPFRLASCLSIHQHINK